MRVLNQIVCPSRVPLKSYDALRGALQKVLDFIHFGTPQQNLFQRRFFAEPNKNFEMSGLITTYCGAEGS